MDQCDRKSEVTSGQQQQQRSGSKVNDPEFIKRYQASIDQITSTYAPPEDMWPPKSTNVIGHDETGDAKPKLKTLPNILHHVGNTPLVRLNRVGKNDGLECELLVKCEFFNAGGSIKDRIGLRMIEEAERAGVLKPGMTLIEPTSGNTGIGLALVAAIKGYHCIIVMPEKNSLEKLDTLRALGAEIVRTPTAARYDTPESHIGVARRLNREIPGSIILDQYRNAGNPLAHYDGTAEEILEQCDGRGRCFLREITRQYVLALTGRVDMLVVGTGTGGTLTGIGLKLKQRCPGCLVVGVDPEGSILADPENSQTHGYEVEGIGGDFLPGVLDRSLVDVWIKSTDRESLVTARRLIREEGLLCGGSSGANVWAALQAAKRLKAGQKCVVILPDGVRNYMSKFLNDTWMTERNFMDVEAERSISTWWWNLKVDELPLRKPLTIKSSLTVQDAIDIMDAKGYHQLPVEGEDDGSSIVGVVTQASLMSNFMANRFTAETPVGHALYQQFKTIDIRSTLGNLSRILDTDHFALVVDDGAESTNQPKHSIIGIVSRIDLLHFIMRREKSGSTIANPPMHHA